MRPVDIGGRAFQAVGKASANIRRQESACGVGGPGGPVWAECRRWRMIGSEAAGGGVAGHVGLGERGKDLVQSETGESLSEF